MQEMQEWKKKVEARLQTWFFPVSLFLGVIHPGRPWAQKLRPNIRSREEILKVIAKFLGWGHGNWGTKGSLPGACLQLSPLLICTNPPSFQRISHHNHSIIGMLGISGTSAKSPKNNRELSVGKKILDKASLFFIRMDLFGLTWRKELESSWKSFPQPTKINFQEYRRKI